MDYEQDVAVSTDVKSYATLPFSYNQLLASGYTYRDPMEINCLIKNVYCLSSVKGYVPRSNMSYVYDPTQRMLYCLGGYITDEQMVQVLQKGGEYKKMVIHAMNADSHTWTTIPSQDYKIHYNIPESLKKQCQLFQNTFVQRYGHRSAMFDSKLFVFGGSTKDTEDRTDVQLVECFNFETRTWTIPKLKGSIPSITMCHASAYSGYDWYIHGGFLCGLYAGQFSNLLYHYDMRTDTISLVRPVESEDLMNELYRDCHSMVYISHCLYVFGGRLRSSFGMGNELSDQLYSFSILSRKWKLIQNVGTPPEPRRGHTATAYKHYMIIFGGCNVNSLHHFNDCFFFDTAFSQWYKINIFGMHARPRRSHGCVLIDNSLVIFGGTAPKFEAKTDKSLLKKSFNGSQDQALDDISDTIIIELFPKLLQRCIHVILDNQINFRNYLPPHIIRTVEEFILSMRQESEFVYGPGPGNDLSC